MDHLQWTAELPELRNPVLVVAFEGWNDAGDAASTSAEQIVEHYHATQFATLDPEQFYDFTHSRPLVRLDEDGQRFVEWPTNSFSAAVLPSLERDLIVLRGVEPELRWRTFCAEIVGLAQQLNVDMAISLGALIADVTHTRPTTIYSTTSDPTLQTQLDLEPSNYEGPTGIVGVLSEAFRDAGIPAMSLWATVPSYVPHSPAPKAALALLGRLSKVLDSPILRQDLVSQANDYDKQLNDLLAQDPETSRYVADLEEQYDSELRATSSGEMIEDLEAFLRDQP